MAGTGSAADGKLLCGSDIRGLGELPGWSVAGAESLGGDGNCAGSGVLSGAAGLEITTE